MARCAPLTTPPCAVRDRSAVSRLAGARRGLCYLPVALAVDDDENRSDAAVDALRGALGYAAEGGVPGLIDGSEAAHVARSVLALPPLAQVIDGCLLAPIRARCSAGRSSCRRSRRRRRPSRRPRCSTASSSSPSRGSPRRSSASLRVAHRRAPRVAPTATGFHTHLEGLVGGGVPGGIAASPLRSTAPAAHRTRCRRRRRRGGRQADAPTLDAAGARALSELRLRFSARWPLQLAVSDACLATHEVSRLLLQLRRAGGRSRRRAARRAALGSGDGEPWCAHPWRVLVPEVLHLVGAISTLHSASSARWRSFRDRPSRGRATSTAARRTGVRGARPPPLPPRGGRRADHRAIEAILGLALRRSSSRRCRASARGLPTRRWREACGRRALRPRRAAQRRARASR